MPEQLLSVRVTSYFYRILLILLIIVPIAYGSYLWSKEKIWRTEITDDPQDIQERTQARGLLASLLGAFITGIIGVIMAYTGVTQNNIEIGFGFLFAPVLGFLLDSIIGTDTGLRLARSSLWEGIKYTISRLADGSFIRFVVTFLMDLYISKPMSAIFKAFSIFNLEKIALPGIFAVFDRFALQNITSIVQGLVGIITFQTYSNQSRFLWAYPDKTLAKENRVSSFTIMVVTSLAGIFYISQYAKEVTSLSMHIAVTIMSFILLTILYQSGTMEEEYISPEDYKEDDKQKPYTENKFYTGVGIFSIFLFIGIILPFWKRTTPEFSEVRNSLSDLGKLLRKEVTDPITRKVLAAMDTEFQTTGKI